MIKVGQGARLDELSREQILNQLNEAVRPNEGVIPAFIFNDETIHKLEHEKIFLKNWLLIGHESEVPNNNDYITRDLAGYSVIISRGKDGVLRGFFNMCTHRGMKLCRADKGSTGEFTCAYHGFVFKNSGDLVGVPLQNDIYGGNLNKTELAMHQINIDTYKGLIFGTWNENPEPLTDFIGDFKWYLDLIIGRAEMEVVGPPQRFVVNCNWKVGSDNFNGDSYHTMMTHGSIVKLGMVPNATYSKTGYQIHTKEGHGINIGMGNPDFAFPEEVIPEYKANLTAEQLDVLSNVKNIVGTIFPNLSFLISHTKIKDQLISNTSLRLWRPISADKIEVITWFFVEKNASEDWKRRSREAFVLTFSASGIFEQDDTEVFTDITDVVAGMMPYAKNINFTYVMGMHREPISDFSGPGTVYDDKFSEANSRKYYQTWLEKLNA